MKLHAPVPFNADEMTNYTHLPTPWENWSPAFQSEFRRFCDAMESSLERPLTEAEFTMYFDNHWDYWLNSPDAIKEYPFV